MQQADNLPRSKNRYGSLLYSLGILLLLTLLFAKELRFWTDTSFTIIASSKITILFALILLISGYFISKSDKYTPRIVENIFIIGLPIVLLSDWLNRPYNFLQGPSIRGEIFLFSFVSFILLTKFNISRLFCGALLISNIILITSFLKESAGRLLFIDDHTVFLHRLYSLKENFPFIPFYDPYWNAGNDARDFFATGALNFFTIFSPLIYSFELTDIYNILIAILMFIITPLLMFLAGRMAKFSISASAIAAILSVTSNLLWYRWALQYGTLGFLTTLAFIPLNLIFSSIILDKERTIPLWLAVTFIITTSLMLMWSLSGIAFLPVILFGVYSVRSIIKKRNILLIVATLILLNLPWMTVFWSVSKVSTIIIKKESIHSYGVNQQDELAKKNNSPSLFNSLSKSLKVFRETALSTSPIILMLAIPGYLLLTGNLRKLFLLMSVWLLLLGSLLYPLNPRLELDRMLLILIHLLSLPVALFIEHLSIKFKSNDASMLYKSGISLVLGFLFAGIFSAAGVLHNRTLVQYSFAGKEVDRIRDAISTYNQRGRILFSGFVLHELNNGHLAPLTNFTGVPLMASSHVHNLWRYKQIFPEEFLIRKDTGGIEEYLDLFNVGAVFAHEDEWKNYFSTKRETYTKIWQGERFDLFLKNGFRSNYIIEGDATIISQEKNGIRIKMNSPSAIIKFVYYPFLEASPCKIEPFQYSDSVKLVKLTECPVGSEVKLKAGSILKRVGIL